LLTLYQKFESIKQSWLRSDCGITRSIVKRTVEHFQDPLPIATSLLARFSIRNSFNNKTNYQTITMKLSNIALCIFAFAIACSFAWADDEPQTPLAKRIALRRPIGKAGKPTSTTTTQAPALDNEGEEIDYQDENQEDNYGGDSEEAFRASSTTTTTTEAPKKVVGPVIRPFRSNDDFLNSLKRRQMNAKKHRANKVTVKPTKGVEPEEANEAQESAPAPAPVPKKKSTTPYNRRKYSKPGKPEPQQDNDAAAAEESEQQQKEDLKPRRPIGRLPNRKF